MTRNHPAQRRTRILPVAIATAALGVFAFIASGAASADLPANGRPVPPPPTSPTSADQIQNIDQVRTAIKGYYGDTVTSQLDPVSGTVPLHTFSPTGAYANEMTNIETDADKYLDETAKHFQNDTGNKVSGTPAILLDIDDTTLNTYSYEIFSN